MTNLLTDPLRSLTIAVLLMLAVACGGDAASETAPASDVVSTATATAVISVTPVPTSVPLSARSSQDWAIRGLTSLRTFPSDLEAESNPLPRNEMEALWSEFLRGTRAVDNESGQEVFDLCSDLSGMNLEWFDETELEAAPFTWSVRRDPGGGWNAIRLESVTDDPSLMPPEGPFFTRLGRRGGVFTQPEGSVEGGVGLFFDSPDCD